MAPAPKKPSDKKQTRVEIRKAFVPVVHQLAVEQAKTLAEVTNDAIRYYLEHAFAPPRWPPAKVAGNPSESK